MDKKFKAINKTTGKTTDFKLSDIFFNKSSILNFEQFENYYIFEYINNVFDKNGKEYCEGNTVLSSNGQLYQLKKTNLLADDIEQDKYTIIIGFAFIDVNPDEGEIIGHAYENPE